MSGTCDCGRTLRGDRQQCRQCALDDDVVATDERDRAVDAYEHAPSCDGCGDATHIGEWLLEDGSRAPNGISDEGARYFCPDCQPDEIDAVGDAPADAPAFEKASELRTDGGCDLITVSTHARGRWMTRSDCPRVDPAVAWGEAEPFRLHDLEGDEGRYHSEGGVVMIRKDQTIVTVLNEDVSEPLDRAELFALGANVSSVPDHPDAPGVEVDGGDRR